MHYDRADLNAEFRKDCIQIRYLAIFERFEANLNSKFFKILIESDFIYL